MRQSARASPGAGMAARTRLIRRSLLVTVPSFSPHVLAGRSTSAYAAVAVPTKASCTTTKGQRSSAARTSVWSGIDCAGFVQAIHNAWISPRAAASNISTAVLPGVDGTCRRPTAARLRRGVRHSQDHDAPTSGSPSRRPRARPSRWADPSATTAPHPRGRSGPQPSAGRSARCSSPCRWCFDSNPGSTSTTWPATSRTSARLRARVSRRRRIAAPPTAAWCREPAPSAHRNLRCARKRTRGRSSPPRSLRAACRGRAPRRCRAGSPGADRRTRRFQCAAGRRRRCASPGSRRARLRGGGTGPGAPTPCSTRR